MRPTLLLLAFAVVLSCSEAAHADAVTIQIMPDPAVVAPGMCQLITVTVTNAGPMPVDIKNFTRTGIGIEDPATSPWSFSMTFEQFAEIGNLFGILAPGASKVAHFCLCLDANAPADARLAYEVGVTFVNIDGAPGRALERGAAQAVPEPATALLLGAGLAGAALRVRRRRSADESKLKSRA